MGVIWERRGCMTLGGCFCTNATQLVAQLSPVLDFRHVITDTLTTPQHACLVILATSWRVKQAPTNSPPLSTLHSPTTVGYPGFPGLLAGSYLHSGSKHSVIAASTCCTRCNPLCKPSHSSKSTVARLLVGSAVIREHRRKSVAAP